MGPFEEEEEGTDLASDGAHGKQPRVCIRVCMHTYMNNRPIFLPRTTRSSGFPSEDVCFRRFHGAVVSSIPTPCNALHSAPFKPKNTFFGQISGSSQMRRSAVRGVVRLFSGCFGVFSARENVVETPHKQVFSTIKKVKIETKSGKS